MKILTLNTWQKEGPWQKRWDVIISGLKTLRPDVVGFQELFDYDWARDVHKRSGYREVVFDPAIEGLVFLSQFPVLESKGIQLPTQSLLEDFKRCALYMKIKAGDEEIACFNTHLSWKLFFTAALQNIPPDVKEAARIDGLSNPLSIARHISIPMISPVIVTVIMLQIIGTLKIFDIIWATTKGGPGISTTVLSIMMYREAFLRNNFGYAETIAVFMFLLVLVVSLVYLRIARFGKDLWDPT